MAEVKEPTRASEKKAEEPKKKVFGVQKKPDTIIYRLVQQNDVKLRADTPLYPPYIRFPNIDIIVWEDGTREIRWLPGEQTIFVDEQEKDGRKIPDNILHNPNNRFEIINGDIRVRPFEKTKIQFLDMCNRNVDSQFLTGRVTPIFAKYTEEKRVSDLMERQAKQKEAIQKSWEASEDLVYRQAEKLNIPLIIAATNESRTIEAIITDYRQLAMDNPIEFLRVYNS